MQGEGDSSYPHSQTPGPLSIRLRAQANDLLSTKWVRWHGPARGFVARYEDPMNAGQDLGARIPDGREQLVGKTSRIPT